MRRNDEAIKRFGSLIKGQFVASEDRFNAYFALRAKTVYAANATVNLWQKADTYKNLT